MKTSDKKRRFLDFLKNGRTGRRNILNGGKSYYKKLILSNQRFQASQIFMLMDFICNHNGN